MSKLRSWMLMSIVGLMFVGCVPANQNPPTPTPQVPPQTIRLNQNDDRSSVSLRVGDTLEVELPGNPSTGFSWQTSLPTSPVLVALGQPEFSPDSGAIGAAGRVKLRFQAALTGTVQLSLVYRRSFENQPPARTFGVNVTVR